jgi:glycosyltransferase involved in cell wall biosynthesis
MRKRKSALLIACNYPPSSESSGVQRTLKFSQYLPEYDWEVQVLTMHPMAYGKQVSNIQLREIPDDVFVKRAFALNTVLHLSIKGRYLGWMALPDRWVSWVPFGVFSGLRMITKGRPDVIWSTYPYASAHLIALILHRFTGTPWVADFRDPMLYSDDHLSKIQRKIFHWIEYQAVKHSSRVVFTTPSAIERYAMKRYPDLPINHWFLIPNGYDEDNFKSAEKESVFLKEKNKKANQYLLIHSGILYPKERDPSHFFAALSTLLGNGKIKINELKIILRATRHDQYYKDLIRSYKLDDIVFIEPAIAYEQALAEMMAADGLLLFQGAICNHQVPAKVYEYIRARKPIFALTDRKGDTAGVLEKVKSAMIVSLDDENEIAHGIVLFMKRLKANNFEMASEKESQKHTRKRITKLLACLFDDILSQN